MEISELSPEATFYVESLAKGLEVEPRDVLESLVIDHMARFHAPIRVFGKHPQMLPEFVKHGDGTPYVGEELFDTLIQIHERELKRKAGKLPKIQDGGD